MSSILTNNGAMVALQTLKSINSGLLDTQKEISTGKSVASAKDNSAVWAISKVMESDVKGFKGISDSLALGESTVSVARQASETVTDLLTDIKGKIVAAQEDNVDRTKIQSDIDALVGQIGSVVGAAQFNGLNLVDGSASGTNTNGQTGINVLSSLDRAADGSVSSSSIGVDAQNLSLTAGAALTTAAASIGGGAAPATIDENGSGTETVTLDTFSFQGGGAALASDDAAAVAATTTGLLAGDTLSFTIGSVEAQYTVKEGDTEESLVSGLKNAFQGNGLSDTDFTLDLSTAGQLAVTNETNAAVSMSFTATRGTGGLGGLSSLDVSNGSNAATALGSIENMIQTSIDAAASFGSVQGRIETQSTFVSNLTDSLKSGIGAMVDANMEEASARLQALQTQQQLGIQALSIANQAPQSIMSLFR
ncbi:flagellin N-terminal helical domain-containing protein [Cochlodiniinecator piscidefendens]|uniref:flagellin N-terminal helical domain-containing protein n=1 Tax=Cochlodiniinecator piscidefendens TaxID=2715756 RepID=UPI00140C7468|nr:flagellin [Cochlodiniinecator piscidefendens]